MKPDSNRGRMHNTSSAQINQIPSPAIPPAIAQTFPTAHRRVLALEKRLTAAQRRRLANVFRYWADVLSARPDEMPTCQGLAEAFAAMDAAVGSRSDPGNRRPQFKFGLNRNLVALIKAMAECADTSVSNYICTALGDRVDADARQYGFETVRLVKSKRLRDRVRRRAQLALRIFTAHPSCTPKNN